MIRNSQHIIQKQVLDIEYASMAMEKQFSPKVKTILTETIIPGLSGLFDKLASEETHRIERLEIDLGALSSKDLETNLPNLFLRKIEKEIISLMKEKTNVRHRRSQKMDKTFSMMELLLHFIKTGSVPWWFSPEKTTDFNKILKQQLNQKTPGLSDSLKAILKHETSRKRIVFHFSTQMVNDLIAFVYKPHLSHNFMFFKTTLTEELTSLVSEDPVFKVEQIINLMLLQLASETKSTVKEESLAGALTNLVCNYYKLSKASLIKALQSRTTKVKPNNDQRIFMEAVLKSISKTNMQRLKVTESTGELPNVKTETKEKAEAKKSINKSEQQVAMAENNDTLYIENAGLVILAPFLISFFKQLGLIKDKNFVNETSLFKAVNLIQYLSNSQRYAEEYMLPLNKIICGLDTEVPVNTKLDLSNLEKEEANNLLKAVITNWKQLKNTSVGSLQTSFLQRKGSLEKTESGWLLRVERTSIDILLDSLPWSISIIKLPWMKGIISVEW